ncbi:MAG: hypothetical protein ACK4MH_06580 [Brevundimonas sp.]|uniref:hypothetical protein n=1 Tax=Brevundimonas sp. TaxID=1871086 RepID=UPI00391D6BC8
MADCYREKYVAFIDMLGFSALVATTADDPSLRPNIAEAMDVMRSSTAQNEKLGLNFTQFSDCIVISSDPTEHGLFEILESIRTIAENLLQLDILIRGGLTRGNIHHDADLMFGPAMLEAYGMERDATKHPTVMISAAVKEDCDSYQWGSYCVIRDIGEPERWYVHYLRNFHDYDPTPVAGKVVMDKPALLIRHYIARRLANTTGRVRDKALWLETYWNDTAGAGVLGRVDPVGDLAVRTFLDSGYRTVRRQLVS